MKRIPKHIRKVLQAFDRKIRGWLTHASLKGYAGQGKKGKYDKAPPQADPPEAENV